MGGLRLGGQSEVKLGNVEGVAGGETRVDAVAAVAARLRRTERRRKLRDAALGIAVPVALIVAWQICATYNAINVTIFSSPLDVIRAARSLTDSGVYPKDIEVTILELLVGYSGGALVGIAVGMVTGYFRVLRAAFGPVITFGYAVPMITILPIMLVIFGLGEVPKVLTTAIAIFFIVEISTMETVRRIDPKMLEVGRAYGAAKGKLFRHVVFPAALPGVFTGLRVAAPIGLVVVIAIEFVAANNGLGYLIWNAWTIFAPQNIYLGVVTAAVIGGLFTGLVVLIRRLALPWARRSTP